MLAACWNGLCAGSRRGLPGGSVPRGVCPHCGLTPLLVPLGPQPEAVSLSLAEVKGSSFGADDILLPPWTVPSPGVQEPLLAAAAAGVT